MGNKEIKEENVNGFEEDVCSKLKKISHFFKLLSVFSVSCRFLVAFLLNMRSNI